MVFICWMWYSPGDVISLIVYLIKQLQAFVSVNIIVLLTGCFCIGPGIDSRSAVLANWPWQRVNIADWESIRGQYRNNQLITLLLNNSTYVVYTTNIRHLLSWFYTDLINFTWYLNFRRQCHCACLDETVKNFQYAFSRMLLTFIQQGIILTMFFNFNQLKT